MENTETKSLVALTDEMDRWNKAIIQAEGEISPELESALANIEKDLASKVDNYDYVLERMDLERQFFEEKSKFYKELAKRYFQTMEKIEERIKFAMKKLEVTELKGNEKRFVISPTKGKIIVEKIDDLDPAYKMLVTPQPFYTDDKDKLRGDLELGLDVKGARLEIGTMLRVYAVKAGDKKLSSKKDKVDSAATTDKKLSSKTKEVTK